MNWNELDFEIALPLYDATQALTSELSVPTLSLNNMFPYVALSATSTAAEPFSLDTQALTPTV